MASLGVTKRKEPASDDEDEFSLPRDAEPTGYLDFDTIEQANINNHIPQHNVGYRLLQKMGWKAGQGLGSLGQGRTDPIPIECKQDSLGVGKAEEENQYHKSTTAHRRALDSEKQLTESEAERAVRESLSQRHEAIQKDVKEVMRSFYCELCDKQYSKISEYEQHLQSYDHHHKKRLKEMKEETRKSPLAKTEKKREREKKREERELKRMQEAIRKRTGEQDVTAPPSTDQPSVLSHPSHSPLASSSFVSTPTPDSVNASSTTTDKVPSAPASSGSGWTTVNEPQSALPSQAPVSASSGWQSVSMKVGKKPEGAPKLSFGLGQSKPGGIKFGFKNKK